MIKLFIGIALTILNYDVSVSGHVMGVFPHFLGFLLIVLAINELEKKDDTFERVMLPSYIMIVYSLAFYAAKSFGASFYLESHAPYLLYFIQLLETIGTMLVIYFVIFGIVHYEHRLRIDVGAEKMKTMWKVLGISFILYYVGYMTVLMYGGAADLSNAEQVTKNVLPPFILFQGLNGVKNIAVVVFIFMLYKVTMKMKSKIG
jgi:hypothetical protein